MFHHKKRFGQNFLIDQAVIQEITTSIAPQPNETIIEIGPGLGAITIPLLIKCNKLIAIELDHSLIVKLTAKFTKELKINKLTLINQDVLTVKFDDLFNNISTTNHNNIKIVGNLPYNISTPLLFKLFTVASNVTSMYFLLQKEVAERLTAMPNTHQYGRLSITAQYHAQINIMFYVGAKSFNPKPQVESALVELIPYKELPITAINYQYFNQLVTHVFSQRRKIIANSLKKYCTQEDLKLLNINPNVRPEEINVTDFVRISNYLFTSKSI